MRKIIFSFMLGLLPVAALEMLMVRTGTAQGRAFETIYSFQGSLDGGQPLGGVVIGKAGKLYGTTYFGGTSGNGTVFELSLAGVGHWKETVLHNFSGPDGTNSAATLFVGSTGALYGTTQGGGTGVGTVFELAPPSFVGGAWAETVLYTLTSGNRTQNHTPNGTLAVGPGGTLYLTTQGQLIPQALQYGTVDSVMPPAYPGNSWTGHIIYDLNVPGVVTGSLPLGGVVFDGNALFGMTEFSGNDNVCGPGCGVVYEVTPPAKPGGAWTGAPIYVFGSSPNDGAGPKDTLSIGPGGVLYGTTFYGGSGPPSQCSTPNGSGCGTVFQLTPPVTPGGTWTESVIYSFTGVNGDGAYPVASVAVGKNGALYGTTQFGGSFTSGSPCGFSAVLGCGTVFELTPPATPGAAWTETVLHSFSGQDDGSMPVAGLALSASDVLYGTTPSGGAFGQGTVFAIKP